MSAASAGLLLAALPISLGVVAPFAGKLADRIGARSLTTGGMLLTMVGLAGLAIVRHPEVVLLVELAGIGIGLGAFTPANNAAIMLAAPPTRAGLTGGILNLTRGLGTSLGVALTGLVFTVLHADSVYADRLNEDASLARAFAGAMIFLIIVALVAAVLSAFLHPALE